MYDLVNHNNVSDTTNESLWDYPVLVDTKIVGESIELIYTQRPNFYFTYHPFCDPDKQVFKIVFSCKNGKWHKSDRIYGTVVPAKNESYDFD